MKFKYQVGVGRILPAGSDFGQFLRNLRRERDLTQQELGACAGIHGANIENYELARAHPSRLQSDKLAEFFAQDKDAFWELVEDSRYQQRMEPFVARKAKKIAPRRQQGKSHRRLYEVRSYIDPDVAEWLFAQGEVTEPTARRKSAGSLDNDENFRAVQDMLFNRKPKSASKVIREILSTAYLSSKPRKSRRHPPV